MDEATRFNLVYAIVGTLLIVGVPLLVRYRHRRKREKLRRRGIKTHGH